MSVIEKIDNAIHSVETALRALDLQVEATPCKCCGVSLRKSLDDYNASKELEAMLRRLRGYAAKIEAGEWHGRSKDGSRNDRAGKLKKSVPKITVTFYPVEGDPQLMEVSDTLESYQRLVGGEIRQTVFAATDGTPLALVYNGEGLDLRLRPNPKSLAFGLPLVGDFFVVGLSEDHTRYVNVVNSNSYNH